MQSRGHSMNVTKLSDVQHDKTCTYEFSITDFSKELRFLLRKSFIRQHLSPVLV